MESSQIDSCAVAVGDDCRSTTNRHIPLASPYNSNATLLQLGVACGDRLSQAPKSPESGVRTPLFGVGDGRRPGDMVLIVFDWHHLQLGDVGSCQGYIFYDGNDHPYWWFSLCDLPAKRSS